MNLTDERLKEIATEPHRFSHINYGEVQCMAEELLQLRALRDAGDCEVEELYSQPHEPEARKKLRDIARRAIVSRDEVVGLLKWACREIPAVRHSLMMSAGEDESRRILEIVEGK